MLDELIVRVIAAVVYGLLLVLILPSLRRDFKRSKGELLKFHRRLQERGLTIFDAWKKRYYLPEAEVSLKEQVKRTVTVSIFLTAFLGLLAVGLGFSFNVPPDRAIWAPPIGGLLILAFGAFCIPLIQHTGKRLGKPLEPKEGEIPSTIRVDTIPMKPWLLLGFVVAIVAFFAAAFTSYFFQRKINWSSSSGIALGTFIGLILVMWLMKREG
ncbi:MAG: hypothetical protein OEZ25_04870 [Candidatus Bathyarchaeota archaeon]|nr:hypothetical protein [Candidatus Bathyarchaeota archaeon]